MPVHDAAGELHRAERAPVFVSSLTKAVQPSRLAQFRPAAAEAEAQLESEVEAGPAPTKIFAEPLPGDDEDVAALRQLLAQASSEAWQRSRSHLLNSISCVAHPVHGAAQ